MLSLIQWNVNTEFNHIKQSVKKSRSTQIKYPSIFSHTNNVPWIGDSKTGTCIKISVKRGILLMSRKDEKKLRNLDCKNK